MSFVNAVSLMMGKNSANSRSTVLVERLFDYLDDFEDDYSKDSYFHVSSLYYMCPRCEVYKAVLPPDKLPSDRLDAMTQARFDIGHAMHYWYQNKYLGPMGVLKGKWRCRRCHNVVNGFMPTTTCEKCAGEGRKRVKDWEFDETVVLSKKWNIKGKIDGILAPDGEEYLMDLKTCKPSLFSKLQKPWPSAIFQVQVYMWLLKIQHGVLVYIDKSADGSVPAKEFPVEYSLKTVNSVKGKITAFRMGMESKSLPDCLCRERSFGLTCSMIEAQEGTTELIEKWVASGDEEVAK